MIEKKNNQIYLKSSVKIADKIITLYNNITDCTGYSNLHNMLVVKKTTSDKY